MWPLACCPPHPRAPRGWPQPSHTVGRKTYRVLDTYIQIHSNNTVDYVSYLAVYGTFTAICVIYITVHGTYTKLYSAVYNIYCWVYGIYGYVHIVDCEIDIFCYIKTYIDLISNFVSHDEAYTGRILAQTSQVQEGTGKRSTKITLLHPVAATTSRIYGSKDGELQPQRYVVV